MKDRIIKRIEIYGQSIDTPYYLFDEVALSKNYHTLTSLLYSTNFSIAYSLKTNPLTKIAAKVKEFGAWAEAVSLPELQIAYQIGFETILFNGIYKSENDLIYAINIGALIILDGKQQVDIICKLSQKIPKKVKVGLRISSFPAMQDNGTRFGFFADSNGLIEIIKQLITAKNIEICCLHCHLGTNIQSPTLYGKALKILKKVRKLVEESGATISLLDIGGGMPAHIDRRWAQTFQKSISQFKEIRANGRCKLIIEPGRSIVESAGYLVTRIIDIREGANGYTQDVIVDAGTNSIMGSTWGIDHKCTAIPLLKNKTEINYRIFGSLCSSDDLIKESFKESKLSVGDLIVIESVGAYDFSTSYQFSNKAPNIYILSESGELRSIFEGCPDLRKKPQPC